MPLKTLFLTSPIEQRPQGGRAMLTKLNLSVLSSILGDNLIVYELPASTHSSLFHNVLNTFRGFVDGINPQVIEDLILTIQHNDIQHVFIDGSNLGACIPALKRRIPHVYVSTFFHNVESRFFLGAFVASFSLRSFGVFLANTVAEYSASRLSDTRITLSQRDSRLLHALYGKSATHISPIALEDSRSVVPSRDHIAPKEPYILFVGGNFYANTRGITWFVEHVVPLIDIKLYIVGKGMESFRHLLDIPGCVEIIGPVDSVSPWYEHARFVIAPIFEGSGMKTKVAEAMMHGKKVVGTREAFSGYEFVSNKAGWSCTSCSDFVAVINEASSTITSRFDHELRTLYEENFSVSAATNRLSQILHHS